jgi:hypothetical protein
MSSHDTVTRSGAVTVTPQQEFRRSDLHEGVGEKKTDSLRLLVDVGGHGAFEAAFRNRAEIVLAHLNRQSAKSAALALAQRPHSLGMVHANRSQGVNGPRGPYGSVGRGGSRPAPACGSP